MHGFTPNKNKNEMEEFTPSDHENMAYLEEMARKKKEKRQIPYQEVNTFKKKKKTAIAWTPHNERTDFYWTADSQDFRSYTEDRNKYRNTPNSWTLSWRGHEGRETIYLHR